MPEIIAEKTFSELFLEKLGEQYERALAIFRQCGQNMSWDITNVLLHAADRGKVNEVLQELEEHYKKHLTFQPSEICGTVEDRLLGVNKTKAMFTRICTDILGLCDLSASST